MSDKWDTRFMAQAELIAGWSKDPSTGVGAVIVDPKNRVVSQGFNGFPRACSDDANLLADRDEKLRRTLHAEQNALLFAHRSVEGCTVYVTHPPCARCAAMLIQAGIQRVVYRKPGLAFFTRWADDVRSAETMYFEAGVAVGEVE